MVNSRCAAFARFASDFIVSCIDARLKTSPKESTVTDPPPAPKQCRQTAAHVSASTPAPATSHS
jgi:hypothetical protein